MNDAVIKEAAGSKMRGRSAGRHLGRVLALSLGLGIAPLGSAEESLDLVAVMADMQRFAHKIQLSLDAENLRLADFYAHELEAAVARASSIDSYGDYPVGRLSASTLKPLMLQLGTAIDSGELPRANTAFDQLLSGCNSCHQLTEHGYIHLQRNAVNPYLQSFAPLR